MSTEQPEYPQRNTNPSLALGSAQSVQPYSSPTSRSSPHPPPAFDPSRSTNSIPFSPISTLTTASNDVTRVNTLMPASSDGKYQEQKATHTEIEEVKEERGGELPDVRLSGFRKLTMGSWWMGDVDAERCFFPLLVQCFMTGLIAAPGFTACYIWCPFQTGNVAQLGLALARLFTPPIPGNGQFDHDFLFPDKQALISLTCFIGGTGIGRLGDRIGNNTRGWLVGATVLQGLMLLVATLCCWRGGEVDIAPARNDPSWITGWGFATLALISAATGLQGIIGVRLNTAFGTTLVLTTVWCSLINDPFLFARKLNRARDEKIMAVVAIFVGTFTGRAIIDVSSTVVCLGLACGLKTMASANWLLVKGKREGEDEWSEKK